MESLVKVSAFMGKSVGAIARETGMMEEGMLRTRGTLFHLLKPTGIFGNDIHKARKEWAALTAEQREAKLSYGLEKLAKGLKDAPLSMEQLTNKYDKLRDTFKVTLGKELLTAIQPVFKDYLDKLSVFGDDLADVAKKMGPDLKRWAKDIGDLLGKGLDWIHTHQEQIKNSIVEGIEVARSFVNWLLAHKTELMMIWGATRHSEPSPVSRAREGLAGGHCSSEAPSPARRVWRSSGRGRRAVRLRWVRSLSLSPERRLRCTS